MLDWMEVLKRLFQTYGVTSQQELGMAMGTPVHFGPEDDLDQTGIPWRLLELAVCDRGLSWDWLLTGAGNGPSVPIHQEQSDTGAPAPDKAPEKTAPDGNASGQPQPDASSDRFRLPRYNTRELSRDLLDDTREEDSAAGGETATDAIRDRLEHDIAEATALLDRTR